MNTFEMARRHLEAVAGALLSVSQYEIEKAVGRLRDARERNSTVWLVGNGGSAATASHFANDLEKMGHVRAIAVVDMVPKILAYGNDHGWERMFSDVIDVNMGPFDVLVAISCSGNSMNVVKAAELFGPDHLIILTGNNDECELSHVGSRVMIGVAHEDIKVQEDVHLAICHSIVGALS